MITAMVTIHQYARNGDKVKQWGEPFECAWQVRQRNKLLVRAIRYGIIPMYDQKQQYAGCLEVEADDETVLRVLQADAEEQLPPDTEYEIRLSFAANCGVTRTACWVWAAEPDTRVRIRQDNSAYTIFPDGGYARIGTYRTPSA